MSYNRLEDDVARINNGTGVTSRIINTTGDFDLYLNAVDRTHGHNGASGQIIVSGSAGQYLVPEHFTVTKNGSVITTGFTNTTANNNRTFTFSPALVAGDSIQIAYKLAASRYSHSGSGDLAIALENNDYIDPKDAVISVEARDSNSSQSRLTNFITYH